MKIILATGIYPPDIGGPATYAHALAEEMTKRGSSVVVITYGRINNEQLTMNNSWEVIRIAKRFPILRWFLYARALKKHAKDADVVIAFSSVSAGVPVKLAKLKCKKILRLGGDFFWERYTARGGMLGLRRWYKRQVPSSLLLRYFATLLLRSFNHIVFSTEMQKDIYTESYKKLPARRVIENAMPSGNTVHHKKNSPFRLLFMGRFVGFKNLPTLLHAVSVLDSVTLEFVGDGPEKGRLEKLVDTLGIQNRVSFTSSLHADEKIKAFAEHDLLVIPSVTEISPNVALEARANGLPVLLTEVTGLSEMLTNGMVVKDLSTPGNIVKALQEVMGNYESVAEKATSEPPKRGWSEVADDFLTLL
jgi:glycosyltransferase involved in cell wall biosynthesis